MMQSCALCILALLRVYLFDCVIVYLCICVPTYLCASKCNLVWSVRGNLATTCSEVSAPCLRSVELCGACIVESLMLCALPGASVLEVSGM